MTTATYAPVRTTIAVGQTQFQRQAGLLLRRLRDGTIGEVRVMDLHDAHNPRVVAVLTAPEEAAQ